MSKEILVALKSQDRIEDMVPCLERVAQPGTKVTFLFRYPVDGFAWAKQDAETAVAALEGKKLVDYYSWEENVKRAERKISPALEALHRKGAEVAVDLYAGSLRKAIKSHAPEGGISLIMTRVGIGQWITSFLSGTISALKLFKHPSFSPVLLIHPRAMR
jgi:hypothetical protein